MTIKAIVHKIEKGLFCNQSFKGDVQKENLDNAVILYLLRLFVIIIAGILSGYIVFCLSYFISFGIIGCLLMDKRKIGTYIDNIIFYFFIISSLLLYLTGIMFGNDVIFAVFYFTAAIIINSSKDANNALLGKKRGYNRTQSLICLIILGFISLVFRYFQNMEVMGGILTGVLAASMRLLIRQSIKDEEQDYKKEIKETADSID